MYWSRLIAAIVLAAGILVGAGTVVTFAMNLSRVAAVVVLALVVCCIVALSALGSRSRRWRQNPYW